MWGGVDHILDFGIWILDLKADPATTQLASNNFNPQSKIQNLKSFSHPIRNPHDRIRGRAGDETLNIDNRRSIKSVNVFDFNMIVPD